MAYLVTVEQTNNKHSRAVVKNNTIIVRLAKRLTEAQKKKHVEELVERMQKKLSTKPRRHSIQPFSLLTSSQRTFIPLTNNQTFTIEYTRSDRNFTKLAKPYHATIQNKNRSQAELQRIAWKLLSTSAQEFFEARVQELNTQTYNVTVHKVTVSHRLSKWGSMSSAGVMHLNPALLFVPEHLRDYVIIHELAHGLEQNHSAKFWAHVEKVLPNYKQSVKELKQYALQ